MTEKKGKRIRFAIVTLIILLLAACGDTNNENGERAEDISYSEEVDYTITGIEPGAGISVTTEKALVEYENLQGWEVELSSTAAMMVELEKAIENEEPIVITGWNPHWMFALYPDMKYLEDPKGVFGEEENIHSLARLGLEEDLPDVYKLIDQFTWEVEDLEEIMFKAEESGEDIKEVAAQWVADNEEKVAKWKKGVDEGNGEEVKLVATQHDSEIAAIGVMEEVLGEMGYHVSVTEVDLAIVYESLASGDADASLAAWLPVTNREYYDKHEGNFVDLGPNLEGARIGLVVPEYMDIDSIEDLEAN